MAHDYLAVYRSLMDAEAAAAELVGGEARRCSRIALPIALALVTANGSDRRRRHRSRSAGFPASAPTTTRHRGDADRGQSEKRDLAAESSRSGSRPRVGLAEAPMPVVVPTMPCARLKWPVPRVISAMISGTMTPSTAAVMPSSIWTATSR